MAREAGRRGTVSAFDADAGLGTVVDEEGAAWPFHCTQIADGSRAIDPGTAVVFEVRPGPAGRWEAAGLVRVS